MKLDSLAALSHDLRQPMHALGLFLDELRAQVLPEEAQRLVVQMDAALLSSQMLTDSVLALSQLEAGAPPPETQAVAMQPLLDRLTARFRGAAGRKALQLRLAPCAHVVQADVALLERSLANLLANAIRYTDAGSVLLVCRRRGERLRIDVRDSGRGIATEHQTRVFEPFFRVPQTGSPQAGTGLGLAIVQRCAAALGWTTGLRSAPGKGSCFSITVPMANPYARREVSAAALGESPSSYANALFPGLQVLLIDSDEHVRAATAQVLRRWGCEVIAARSHADAAAALQSADRMPGLVISDLQSRTADSGLDAILGLRARLGPGVPVLLVSGDTSLETSRDVRRHGLPLLRKPVGPILLAAMLRQLTEGVPADQPRRK